MADAKVTIRCSSSSGIVPVFPPFAVYVTEAPGVSCAFSKSAWPRFPVAVPENSGPLS